MKQIRLRAASNTFFSNKLFLLITSTLIPQYPPHPSKHPTTQPTTCIKMLTRVRSKDRPPQSGGMETDPTGNEDNAIMEEIIIQGEGNTNLSHQVSDSDRDYSRESHAVQFSELDLEEEEVIEDIHFTASNAPSRQSSTLSSQQEVANSNVPSRQSNIVHHKISDIKIEKNKHLLIMRKINNHVNTNRLKVTSVFKQFDTSGDGMLSKIEFRKCCEALLKNALFTITSIEINGLFNSIDVDQSNEVSYREFLQELRNCDPLRQKSMQAKALAGPTMEEQQAIARALKKKELELTKQARAKLSGLQDNVDPLEAV